jgi:hypothetical protein
MRVFSLQERQKFWSWGYATQSFQYVVAACDYIANPPKPLAGGIERILYTGIIATYARPFTKSWGVEALPQEIVPKKHLKLHMAILDARNKEIAHVDARDYKADDPQFGNINQIRLKVTKTEKCLSATCTRLEIGEIRQLSCKLSEKTKYHVDKFCRKYIASGDLPIGTYKLNIDGEDSTPFVKV